MRSFLVLALLALPAFAADGGPDSKFKVDCSLERDRDDLTARGKSLLLEATARAKDVIVVDGNVTVKKGAVVTGTIFVSNGDVVIEAGATVKGAILIAGGKATVAQRSDVKQGIVTLDEGLHVNGGDGNSLDLNLNLEGQSLGKKIVADIVKEMRGCKLVGG
jgi:hypothetical protein